MLQAAAQPLQVRAGLVQEAVPQVQGAARLRQQRPQSDRLGNHQKEAGREGRAGERLMTMEYKMREDGTAGVPSSLTML